MTIAAAIFLIAISAILKFATNFHVQGGGIDTVGVTLTEVPKTGPRAR
jgi:hypothetical protein